MTEEAKGASQAPSSPVSADEHLLAETLQEQHTPVMPSKKRGKRKWIVAGVIAAVLVVAGVGGWVWHEQPGFCNALCHSPMDKYVESYSTTDPGVGIKVHAEADKTCLSCHESDPVLQVSEAMSWVSDSYPMADDGMLATGKDFATEQFCARSGCHNMQEVVQSTWGFNGNDEKYNPHSSHQDFATECGDCHKIHETSTLTCNECHALVAPTGWEAPNE